MVHSLPVGMAIQPSAAIGTLMRPDTLRKYGSDAGFADVTVRPIGHAIFRSYELKARWFCLCPTPAMTRRTFSADPMPSRTAPTRTDLCRAKVLDGVFRRVDFPSTCGCGERPEGLADSPRLRDKRVVQSSWLPAIVERLAAQRKHADGGRGRCVCSTSRSRGGY